MCSISTVSILRSLCFFVLVYASHFAAAQVSNKQRIEIPLGWGEGQFEVIPAKEDGLFLYRRLISSSSHHLQLFKLDTAFEVKWHGFLHVDPRFEVAAKRKENDHLYLLLRNLDPRRKDFELFIIRQENGFYEKHIIRNFIPFHPTEFQVTRKGVIIGGYFNNVPVVIFYSPSTQASRVLPGLLNEAGELTQIKVYPDDSFDVLISAKNLLRQQTIWIKSYDAQGNMGEHLPLKTDHDKHLIFARSLKTGNGLHLIAGTYGARNSDYSKGIFITRIDAEGSQASTYYSYGDLQNFFKYMKAKREKRVRDRIERRKVKGRKIRFNYRFIVHEIVPHGDKFVLLGEAFYPKYVTVDRSFGWSPGGFSPYMLRDGRIFDGYRYTHAVVMGFDRNGKLLWDNSFEINDVKTFTLEQFVKLEMQDDRVALLYLFENHLRTKIIKGNEVLEGKNLQSLHGDSTGRVIREKRTTQTKLDYWYNDVFYAAGIQEIHDSRDGNRRIFFINKISYDGSSVGAGL